MTKLLVIDLDQTVIDSSIRENECYPNGNLCLDTYHAVKSCPDRGIINDCLTPFGEWLKVNFHSLLDTYTIVFLTARQCDKLDEDSFISLGIDIMLYEDCELISRDMCLLYGGNPREQDSGVYKKDIITEIKKYNHYTDIMVIDDCIKVLNMASANNYRAICARDLYHYANSDFDALFNSL